MIQLAIFFILTALTAAALMTALVLAGHCLVAQIRNPANQKRSSGLKKTVLLLAAAVVFNLGFVAVTQLTASTPRIDAENSIAELTSIGLNGRRQWISLRGRDKSKPLLLFLAGGPGGTQMAAVRHELAELEQHFVVVNWDQPGSGKSYHAEKIRNITVDTYIQDGHALTQYLKERFSQEKIYLVGESWGSALGIFLASRYPEDYHGLIGTGQMIAFAQTERMDYAKAMEIAEDRGDTSLIQSLKANGEPPYFGRDVTWKSAVYLNALSAYMAGNPEIQNSGYNTLRDIASSEYGLLDKINYARGIIKTFNHVYQQLYDIDLRTDYKRLEIPVHFFLGRHDLNAPTALVEEYEQLLEAPDKGITWFEYSGHSPWINERDQFIQEVLSCFLEN